MTNTPAKSISLQEFLHLPETKPAQEFIEGAIIQKTRLKGRHSRLQGKLCSEINQVSESAKIAYAFPELRCSVANRSIVPDIAVFLWLNIPFLSDGEVPDNFNLPPDLVIEILYPEQNPNKVIGNILYCIENGSQLVWFLDPEDQSILVFRRDRSPVVIKNQDTLPVLEGIELSLTAAQVFGWLKMGA